MKHRIKYYSNSDLSTGWNLKKIKEVIENYDEAKENYEINDIIEFYNITQFIDNKIYLNNWDDTYVENLKNTNRKIKASIGKYCSKINNRNVYKTFEDVERNYKEDFFKIIEEYKIYNRINPREFNRLIYNTNYLEISIKNKEIAKYYSNTLRRKFLKYSDSAIILLNEYVLEKNNSIELYIPEELTIEEKESIFIKYIRCKNANINYLRVILNIRSNPKQLIISDKTKLLAKKRIDRETKSIFSKNEGIGVSTLVSFKDGVKDTFTSRIKGLEIECEYDLNWIKENKDYPTILNNFIYLFEFVDSQCRINFVNKESESRIFESSMAIRMKQEYKSNHTFGIKSMLSSVKMIAYYNQLQKIKIKLEEVIKWFFEKYLKDEFQVKNYKINIPTENSTYLEKCRNILIEMDYILKEYKLLVEEGKINHELLEMSSTHMFFQNIPSMVRKKYVYSSSKEYNLISFYFFSDQCMLPYLERTEEKYNNFYSLILNEKVKMEEYPEYDQSDLEQLVENDCIQIDEEGYIEIKDIRKINIFKELYYNGVISYWKYSKESRKIMDELCKKGILKFGDTLLSNAESDYFNYYLNKAKFVNGLDLRNKYIHGCQPNGKDSEKIHKNNYYLFLKLLILLIIKINDDIIIKDSDKYKKDIKPGL